MKNLFFALCLAIFSQGVFAYEAHEIAGLTCEHQFEYVASDFLEQYGQDNPDAYILEGSIDDDGELKNKMIRAAFTELPGSISDTNILLALINHDYMIIFMAVNWSLSKEQLLKFEAEKAEAVEVTWPLQSLQDVNKDFAPFIADVIRGAGKVNNTCMFNATFLAMSDVEKFPWNPSDSSYLQWTDILDVVLASAELLFDNDFHTASSTSFFFNDDQRLATSQDLQVIAQFEEENNLKALPFE